MIDLAAKLPWWCKIVPSLVLPQAYWSQTGGTDCARYCYSVWLRHLVMAHRSGLPTHPAVVAELGPGDSLGIGLAALLSGTSTYYGLDVVKFTNATRNLDVFEELLMLFSKRAPIPDDSEFPRCRPYLKSYEFPNHILNDARLKISLQRQRVDSIRAILQGTGVQAENQSCIFYFAPWDDVATLKENSIDMVYSQAVLEHIDDLEHTYKTLYKWLKPGGCMSHQIDFKCHDIVPEWNGHWTFSDLTWKVMRGRRPYFLNRQPHSRHIDLLQANGFMVAGDIRIETTSDIFRRHLAKRFHCLTDLDLHTSSALIQAVKPDPSSCPD